VIALLFLLLLPCFLGVTPLGAQELTANDWKIVPGHRAGVVTRHTSKKELYRVFNSQDIHTEEIPLGEGNSERATVIYPKDADRRLEIFWVDVERRDAAKWVRIKGPKSKWRTDKGISLGTSLKALEKLNGRPFVLAGFAWDYGGTVIHCNGGRLRELGSRNPNDPYEVPKGRILWLRLDPVYNLSNRDAYNSVLGDREFSSGHPAMQKLNPSVFEMGIIIAPEIE
jgi:hypothetical protein